jgi:hypothetical protein
MKESKCAPIPWALDEHGNLIDAEGEPVEFKGVSLHLGIQGKERAIANRDMALAAPKLLEALRRIAEHTDPDSPEENYRADDREGCLDTVFSIAKRAIAEASKSVD